MNFYNNNKEFKPQSLSDWIAPDCHGLNFYEIDRSFQDVLYCYLEDEFRKFAEPHYKKLGQLAGNELDIWSREADRHSPKLHTRDAFGRNEDWVEFHPSYRKMEKVAFGDFGLHAMSNRSGVLGYEQKIPPVGKYGFQYLFGQSEFGQLCPISATETTAMLINRYADDATKSLVLDKMLSQDMEDILKGGQFMTEKTGGSDVSNIALEAREEDGTWKLYGEKWFCSCVDADVILLLARPEGAPSGNAGLGLFALPRTRENGQRNNYRIVRLKDKMGSRSMASGEIIFDGAEVYPLGDVGAKVNRGLKMMMDQVNMSRLSHGVRAASMMRRCLNESLAVAGSRRAFGSKLIEKPLLRRQLLKMMVPTEQALSMFMHTANMMEQGDAGNKQAELVTRILTPLLKFRTARDNVKVATSAMEVRGGNGYIEDWVNPRMVRDSHLGVLWEGTSNINALDIVTRAIAKSGAHQELGDNLTQMLDNETALPGQFSSQLKNLVDQAIGFADKVAREGRETLYRKVSATLYHTTTATLMAAEGAKLGAMGRDARRLLLSRMVVERKLGQENPFGLENDDFESQAAAALLDQEFVSFDDAREILNT
jgi:alkylation response protein AidB-like acyl-CoA dehydrogenase